MGAAKINPRCVPEETCGVAYGFFHAQQVASILQVSKQAVWLWIGQYNTRGPEGLARTGRGGEGGHFSHGRMRIGSWGHFFERARRGDVTTVKRIYRTYAQRWEKKYRWTMCTGCSIVTPGERSVLVPGTSSKASCPGGI